MRKVLKKTFLIAALLVTVLMMSGSGNAAFAGTTTLKTKTIRVGKSVYLKVSGQAQWGISDTEVARLTVVSPEKAKVTGLKKGSVKVTAKVGENEYTAAITVRASADGGGSSDSVEVLSSVPVPDSEDCVYSLSTGEQVTGHFDDSFAADIMAAANACRSSAGLTSFRDDAVLAQAARVRAAEVAVSFSHIRPNGLEYYTVAGTLSSGYTDSPVYGENLAYGYDDAAGVLDAWMNSDLGHRENLERAAFETSAAAVFLARTGSSGYTAYIVEVFG